MIDLHSHILSGIDDGPQTLVESVALVRAALNNGITHSVCTPHIHFGRFDNTSESISRAFSELKQALHDEGLGLILGMAAEVRFDIEIFPALSEQRIPFLGQWMGERVLLLEFPHGEVPVGAETLTRLLLKQGIRPMIAHPERNKGLMRTPKLIEPLLAQGCLLQVTAGSVIGEFGEPARMLSHALLDKDCVTLVATDTHHIKRRPPRLKEAFQAISEKYGEAMAERLMVDNPWTIAKQHFEK